jgi:hypothetical protein
VTNSLEFYVYVLFRLNGEPFYVGKGKGQRWNDHEWHARKNRYGNRHKNFIIRSIITKGREVPKIKIHEGLSEKQAYEYESAIIKAIGCSHERGPLVNCYYEESGRHIISPAMLENKRQAALKQWSNLTLRELLSKRQRGLCWITNGQEDRRARKTEKIPAGWRRGRTLAPMTGKRHSSESRQKASASNIGKRRPESVKEKLRAVHRGSIWMNDGTTAFKVTPFGPFPQGWVRGRGKPAYEAGAATKAKMSSTRLGRVWMNNGSCAFLVSPYGPFPIDWNLGYLRKLKRA